MVGRCKRGDKLRKRKRKRKERQLMTLNQLSTSPQRSSRPKPEFEWISG
jgi:hypothetical protein